MEKVTKAREVTHECEIGLTGLGCIALPPKVEIRDVPASVEGVGKGHGYMHGARAQVQVWILALKAFKGW